MSQYIANLTNHLINKNGYREVARRINIKSEIIRFIKVELQAGDVGAMNPATLGKIMCSFEIGDVMATRKELSVHFNGDCEEMLRELVSVCLAHAIMSRLEQF